MNDLLNWVDLRDINLGDIFDANVEIIVEARERMFSDNGPIEYNIIKGTQDLQGNVEFNIAGRSIENWEVLQGAYIRHILPSAE